MKVLLLAVGSAVCALGCLADAIIGTVMLFVNWRGGLVVLGVAVMLGAAAKVLDRQKMRAIYGRQSGDLLHEDDAEGQTPLDLAERDFAAVVHGGKAMPVGQVPEEAKVVRT